MALLMKQDFSPRIMSPQWLVVKCRPNMLLRSRLHVITILESGLLFREDSATVEQALPASEAEWVGRGSVWMTRGEKWLSAGAVLAVSAAAPPAATMSGRGALLRVCAYAGCVLALRSAHRLLTRSVLPALLQLLGSYTALARRLLVCIKEYKLIHRDMDSLSATLDAATALLWEQQNSLADSVSRCSLALLSSVPWLYDDVFWDAVCERRHHSEPVKIHHALLVIQSAFLKNVAMAHFVPPKSAKMTYTDHNERIYWIHSQLLPHLYAEYKESYDALDRMYRMLKNLGNTETSSNVKSGLVLNDSWLYSDVHSGVARANIELKVAMNKCTNLDVFLDNSALEKRPFDIEALNNDLDSLIDQVMACVTTLQNSQVKLKKIQLKLEPDKRYNLEKCDDKVSIVDTNILKIEDEDPETKDEVFFFVKTEGDDKGVESTVDLTTGPGKKERDATKIVLGELKKKLVKREDIMRQREKVALEKTMPELKGKLPEFPRQIRIDETPEVKKGLINKILKRNKPKTLAKSMKWSTQIKKKILNKKFTIEKKTNNFDFTSQFNFKPIKILPNVKNSTLKILRKDTATLSVKDQTYIITRWVQSGKTEKYLINHDVSNSLSDIESSSINSAIREAPNSKHIKIPLKETRNEFAKEELLSSSSDSDFDFYHERKQQIEILKDIRRHRAARKKNHPSRKSVSMEKEVKDVMDEGLRPVEYSFGTGMALASVFQGQNGVRLPTMGQEEVFIGDGEVSSDSGNDEES